MLPGLGRLSLTPTGGFLAPGQSPEDVNCVICFASLAAAPPEDQNVWPFDDDQPIWIVACTNRHAFHKGCLRAYARDSDDPSRCPECFVPMLPQILEKVSRPSTGEHAAREEKEAEARAAGQRRDAADTELREQEMLERAQEEFNQMDPEEQRMLERAYEGEDSEEEEEDEDPNPMYDLDRLVDAIIAATDRPSRQAYLSAAWGVTKIINRGNTDDGYEQYRSELLSWFDEMVAANPQSWLLTTIRGESGSRECPYPVKGLVLRLLASYADTNTVRGIMREDDEPLTVSGRLDPSTAGRFTAAVKDYMHHLETLPTIAANPSPGLEYERDTRPQRLADARRVLYYLKWQDDPDPSWLQNPAQPIVNAEDDADAALNAPIGPVGMAKQLVLELSSAIVEGGLDEVSNPEQHHAVMVKINKLWIIFRDWRANNHQLPLARRFPFGRQLVQLWGIANYAQRKQSGEHTHPDFLHTGDSTEDQELLEKVDRYGWMVTILVRTLWLGVSMFWGTRSPYGPWAPESYLMQFFYQYVAQFYYTGNATGLKLFEHDDDTSEIEEANNAMKKQWSEDYRATHTGPWDGPFGRSTYAPTAEGRPYRGEGTPNPRRQRARDGGETSNPRRQRRA